MDTKRDWEKMHVALHAAGGSREIGNSWKKTEE